MATKNWKFLSVFLISFLIFGTMMSLLSSGTAGVKLLLSGNFSVLYRAFLGLFGVERSFVDWAVVFFVALLQGVLIGLVALVWKKRKKRGSNSDNVQSTGLAAGLAILGTGCPTCGTTLLAPVIGAVVGSGGLALAGTISGILTLLAIIVSLFALKRMGQEAYGIMIEEEFKEE